jgi:UDP-glucose 4-epimerase
MSRLLPYYRVNVPVNVLEAMLRHGTRTIVFSSSCATYGTPIVYRSQRMRHSDPYGAPSSRASISSGRRAICDFNFFC